MEAGAQTDHFQDAVVSRPDTMALIRLEAFTTIDQEGPMGSIAINGRMLVVSAFFLWVSNVGSAGDPVRITHNQPFPPFSELRNGKSEGLLIDVLLAASARVGLDLEFVAVPLDQMEQTLKDGRADAFLTAITPERLRSYDFSAPVMTTGGALFVRAPSPTPENLLALSGKVVVTPRAGPLADLISRTAPAVKLSVTRDYEESLARVVEGSADAAALNYQAGAVIAARLYKEQITIPQLMFQETANAVAVPKGQQSELLAQISRGLASIRADNTWADINRRWIGR
jgi:polar amino acid transport system substrate-binding protein